MPGLLKKHNLIEITANKKLKEKFRIESRGYPKIILPEHDYNNIRNEPAENYLDAAMIEEGVSA